MLIMVAAGAYAAFTKSQPTNVMAGVFTFYLVATAWLTVMRKEKETGHTEFDLLLLGLVAGTGGLIFGWQAAHSAAGLKAGDSVPLYVFGSVALLSAAGDTRMLIRGGVSGAKRLVRHLWRMCVALFCRRLLLPGNGRRSSASANWIARHIVHSGNSPDTSP